MLQDIANLSSRSRVSAKLGVFLLNAAYSGCALNVIGRMSAYSPILGGLNIEQCTIVKNCEKKRLPEGNWQCGSSITFSVLPLQSERPSNTGNLSTG